MSILICSRRKIQCVLQNILVAYIIGCHQSQHASRITVCIINVSPKRLAKKDEPAPACKFSFEGSLRRYLYLARPGLYPSVAGVPGWSIEEKISFLRCIRGIFGGRGNTDSSYFLVIGTGPCPCFSPFSCSCNLSFGQRS